MIKRIYYLSICAMIDLTDHPIIFSRELFSYFINHNFMLLFKYTECRFLIEA